VCRLQSCSPQSSAVRRTDYATGRSAWGVLTCEACSKSGSTWRDPLCSRKSSMAATWTCTVDRNHASRPHRDCATALEVQRERVCRMSASFVQAIGVSNVVPPGRHRSDFERAPQIPRRTPITVRADMRVPVTQFAGDSGRWGILKGRTCRSSRRAERSTGCARRPIRRDIGRYDMTGKDDRTLHRESTDGGRLPLEQANGPSAVLRRKSDLVDEI